MGGWGDRQLPLAAQERLKGGGVTSWRQTVAQHQDGLLGYLYLPALEGLPSTWNSLTTRVARAMESLSWPPGLGGPPQGSLL